MAISNMYIILDRTYILHEAVVNYETYDSYDE